MGTAIRGNKVLEVLVCELYYAGRFFYLRFTLQLVLQRSAASSNAITPPNFFPLMLSTVVPVLHTVYDRRDGTSRNKRSSV